MRAPRTDRPHHSDFARPLATQDALLLMTATCASLVFAPFSVTGAPSSLQGATFTLTRSCSPSLVILAVPGAALGSVFDELHGVAALLDVGEVQLATACELRLLTPAERGEGRWLEDLLGGGSSSPPPPPTTYAHFLELHCPLLPDGPPGEPPALSLQYQPAPHSPD